jgi:NAD(P)-dependent dehydrogenase (short-subunit alcohol dehydrogenase family)
MPNKHKSVVITGVSTGIGYASAKLLTKAGFRVFGSLRKDEDARRLSSELGPNFNPLMFDVTDEKAVKVAAARVRSALNGETLGGLVNNAGTSLTGPLVYVPLDEFRRQLDVNLTGVLIATQCFAPLLGVDKGLKGKPGRIINISSASSQKASPFLGSYSAAKAGLEGLSAALRQEMNVFGIDVVVVAPGPVSTPIWEKTARADIARYGTTAFAKSLDTVREIAVHAGRNGLPPERLAATVKQILTARHPRERYDVRNTTAASIILSMLPQSTLDRMNATAVGLTRIRR